MSRFIILRFAILCIFALSFCTVDVATMEQETIDPFATIYLYSGRPNPTWQLSSVQWQQLNELINTLSKPNEEELGPYQFIGQLGYAGFHAHFSIISSYPDVYYVADTQQVILSNPGGHIIFNDRHKVVEKWFRNSAEIAGIQLPI